MRYLRLKLLLLLLLLPLIGLAEPFGYYIQVSGGIAESSIGKSQSFQFADPPLTPSPETAIYTDERETSSATVMGAGAGIYYTPIPLLTTELGLGLHQSLAFHSKGNIVIDTVTGAYNYGIKVFRTMLEGKVFVNLNRHSFLRFAPFVSAGIGYARVTTDNYHTVLSPPITGGGQFSGTGTNNFAWQIGTGMQVKFNSAIGIMVEYRHVDVGQGKLKEGTFGITPNISLKTGKISVNEFVLGIAYYGAVHAATPEYIDINAATPPKIPLVQPKYLSYRHRCRVRDKFGNCY